MYWPMGEGSKGEGKNHCEKWKFRGCSEQGVRELQLHRQTQMEGALGCLRQETECLVMGSPAGPEQERRQGSRAWFVSGITASVCNENWLSRGEATHRVTKWRNPSIEQKETGIASISLTVLLCASSSSHLAPHLSIGAPFNHSMTFLNCRPRWGWKCPDLLFC